jgi:hypothetical protein
VAGGERGEVVVAAVRTLESNVVVGLARERVAAAVEAGLPADLVDEHRLELRVVLVFEMLSSPFLHLVEGRTFDSHVTEVTVVEIGRD